MEFFMRKFFFKKLPNFIEMLGHLKKVFTTNFGSIRRFHAALRIGKAQKNQKYPKRLHSNKQRELWERRPASRPGLYYR